MNPRSHRIAIAAACLAAMLSLAGCVNIDAASASSVRQTMSYPLVFTQTVNAEGIDKQTSPDGKVVRKAKRVTHDLTILGFSRSAQYDDVKLTSKKEKEDEQ